MDTKPVRIMLLGIMVMLVGVALVPVSSGSAIIIPFFFLVCGLGLGILGLR